MPRSGLEKPADRTESPDELRAKAARFRRIARDFQDNDKRVMLEFADELENKARQTTPTLGMNRKQSS